MLPRICNIEQCVWLVQSLCLRTLSVWCKAVGKKWCQIAWYTPVTQSSGDGQWGTWWCGGHACSHINTVQQATVECEHYVTDWILS